MSSRAEAPPGPANLARVRQHSQDRAEHAQTAIHGSRARGRPEPVRGAARPTALRTPPGPTTRPAPDPCSRTGNARCLGPDTVAARGGAARSGLDGPTLRAANWLLPKGTSMAGNPDFHGGTERRWELREGGSNGSRRRRRRICSAWGKPPRSTPAPTPRSKIGSEPATPMSPNRAADREPDTATARPPSSAPGSSSSSGPGASPLPRPHLARPRRAHPVRRPGLASLAGSAA